MAAAEYLIYILWLAIWNGNFAGACLGIANEVGIGTNRPETDLQTLFIN